MSSPSLCSYLRSASCPALIDGKLLALGVLPFRPAPAKARPLCHCFPPPRADGKARPAFYRPAPPLTDGKLLALGVLPFRPAPAKAPPTFYRTAPPLIDGKLLALGVLPFRPAPAKARPTFYRPAPPLIDIKFCNFRRDVL